MLGQAENCIRELFRAGMLLFVPLCISFFVLDSEVRAQIDPRWLEDLRVPLRAIDGFSQLVLKNYEDKLDEEDDECRTDLRGLKTFLPDDCGCKPHHDVKKRPNGGKDPVRR